MASAAASRGGIETHWAITEVWENGRMTDLGLLTSNSSWSSADAINEHDQIVGNSTRATGAAGVFANARAGIV